MSNRQFASMAKKLAGQSLFDEEQLRRTCRELGVVLLEGLPPSDRKAKDGSPMWSRQAVWDYARTARRHRMAGGIEWR